MVPEAAKPCPARAQRCGAARLERADQPGAPCMSRSTGTAGCLVREASDRKVVTGFRIIPMLDQNASPSAPAERRGDLGQDRLDDMGVVGDPELIGYGEQQRIGLGDGLVLFQLLDQDGRLGGVAAAEHGARIGFDIAELILAFVATEIGAVAVVYQREDRAADRHARLATMPGFLPRLAKSPDLFGLLDVEGLSALVEFERRALQVHAKPCRPLSGGVGGGPPPYP